MTLGANPTMPETRRASSTASRITLVIATHVFVLFLVAVIPVVVFEAVASYAQAGHPRAHAFAFIGGVTYPLYVGHWLLKAKSLTLKFTSLHLLSLVTLTFFVSGVCNSLKLPALLLVFPIGWSLLPGFIAAFASVRGNRSLVRACVFSLVISFPLALVMSVLLAYGQGMSSMAGMRW